MYAVCLQSYYIISVAKEDNLNSDTLIFHESDNS